MRSVLATLLFLAVAVTSYLALPCGSVVLAQSGCCMQRDSFNSPWRPNGLSFRACTKLNQERDGDDVLQPTGFVWWNSRC